jgi:hypothetical protein
MQTQRGDILWADDGGFVCGDAWLGVVGHVAIRFIAAACSTAARRRSASGRAKKANLK